MMERICEASRPGHLIHLCVNFLAAFAYYAELVKEDHSTEGPLSVEKLQVFPLIAPYPLHFQLSQST
jgi:hypothetical protein